MVTKKAVEQVSSENTPQQERGRNLFVRVETFDVDGKTIGSRIVDLYHYGTRSWFYDKHLWWAMHNSATVETVPATQDEIGAYIAEQALALADKFNTEKAHVAA